MSLTNDEVLKILKLIDESDYDDVRLEIGDLKLHVQKHGDGESVPLRQSFAERPPTSAVSVPAQPAPARAPETARTPQVVEEPVPEGVIAIKAPMLGTFFRAPAPGEKPFTEVGARVGASDTVCLVEVMKLFNSVKAGVSGTVFKISVENGAMVEHDQVLMLIKPD